MNSWMPKLPSDTKLSMLWIKFDFHIHVELFMKLPYLVYHPPVQTAFAVNFVHLNRFSRICYIFKNFASFFESLKHISFSMLCINFNYIFIQSFWTNFSCNSDFKQIILKYKMQVVHDFKIFFYYLENQRKPSVTYFEHIFVYIST